MSNSEMSLNQYSMFPPGAESEKNPNSAIDFSPSEKVEIGDITGSWMYLNRAVDATGLSEKTIRRYIKKKTLKSRRMGKNLNAPLQVWITAEFMKKVEASSELVDVLESDDVGEEYDLEPDETTSDDQSFSEQTENRTSTTPSSIAIEELFRKQAQVFADEIEKRSQAVELLKEDLRRKEAELKLLPDLQKQMAEKEQAIETEREKLKRELAELQATNEQLLEENRRLEEAQKRPWWKWWFSSRQG